MNEFMTELKKMASEEGFKFDTEDPIVKDLIATDNTNFGGKLPLEAVRSLIDLTVNEHEWMSGMQVETVEEKVGHAPLINFTQRTLFPTGTNLAVIRPTKPVTLNIPYQTRAMRADLVIDKDHLRQAKRYGITDVGDLIRKGWTNAIRNDLADIVINGDESLHDPDNGVIAANDVDLSRSGNDGLMKLTASDVHSFDAEGASFEVGVFDKLHRDMMPTRYHGLPLKWWANPSVRMAYASALMKSQSPIQPLPAQAHTQQVVTDPLGIPYMGGTGIPQMTTAGGPSAAPDTVTDSTGYVTLDCATAFGGYAAGHAGRKVRVLYTPTGVEQSGTVTDGTTTLDFAASDYFGQVAADTTASHYIVYVADETTVIEADPRNFALLFYIDWEAEVDYDKRLRKFSWMLHMDWDFVKVTGDSIARMNRLKLPAVVFPTPAS